MTHHLTRTARINGWDRAAIVALGGAGCALSYDALQQMAVAIHVRGALTYLFPLVIDGFIAYGVRALLVLRTAALAARCYVWLLFGTATAASIWANALHAIRLNQQHVGEVGLRLGDVTVGVLSTLAPLALAGAVHLYILIARRATEDSAGHPGQPDNPSGRDVRLSGDRLEKTGQRPDRVPNSLAAQGFSVTSTPGPVTGQRPASRPEHPVGHREVGGGTDSPGRPVTHHDRTHLAATQSSDVRLPRPPDSLLPVARRAVTESGRVTRQVVAEAIRGQGIPLSNDRLTSLMAQLRAEAKKLSDTRGADRREGQRVTGHEVRPRSSAGPNAPTYRH